MQNNIINIDDLVSAGHLLQELVRRIREQSAGGGLPLPPHLAGLLNHSWVVVRRILCDEPSAFLSDLAHGRVIHPGPAPVPLALRDLLSNRLVSALGQLDPLEPEPLVIDAWPVELHGVALPPGSGCNSIATRRVPRRSTPGPAGTIRGLDTVRDLAVRTVYKHLLLQFFSHADDIDAHPLGGRTTYDVFRVIVRRGDRVGVTFAKFGPPERLEQETVNCNRLLAAAAGDREGEGIRLRRFFGYSHLSDSNRVLVESHPDFLALFVSTLHPLSPAAQPVDDGSGEGADRVRPLSTFPYADEREPQWRTQALIGDVCASLALLQGRLRARPGTSVISPDQVPYDDYHRCGRVGELGFAACQAASESRPQTGARRDRSVRAVPTRSGAAGQRAPHWPVFRVERAELVPTDGSANYGLRCYVRLDDEPHVIKRELVRADRFDEDLTLELRRGDMVRLTLLPSDSTLSALFSGAGVVIFEAYRADVRVGERVQIDPDALALNLRASRVEQLDHLVAGRADVAQPFDKLRPEERKWITDSLRGPLEELDGIETRGVDEGAGLWRIMADRIHGDFFLPNVLYGGTRAGEPIDFSFIDFEQMRFDAPAAWDYAILELSLRLHWLLDPEGPCFRYLASPDRWPHQRESVFDEVRTRLEYVEMRLAFRIGRDAIPPRPDPPPSFERAIHVLSLCAATIRSRYLSACQTRISPPPGEQAIMEDYNKTLRLAAACQALWRRPSGQTDPRRVVVKTILMAIISDFAEGHRYTP